jgi:hypothetical protein
MKLDRLQAGPCGAPFPIYERLVESLLGAHRTDAGERDAVVAHVLGTCAGYAYSDLETVATMMSRLGLEGTACVRIAQTVDAMFIFSTAYLMQSRCGRVAVLCYRGTEPGNLGNWLADADAGSDAMALDADAPGVHAGFYRNVRATRWLVLQELQQALRGRSLLDPSQTVEHPLEALYVTGHSLGGAMAVLFALSLTGTAEHRAITETLRAVYTFGQPMAITEPLPNSARAIATKVFRHVTLRDIVPALPAAAWGRFAHLGQEYRYVNGEWQRAESPTVQLANLRDIPRSLLSFFATGKGRDSSRYTMAQHGPHQYVAALRPRGRVTEFGDRS